MELSTSDILQRQELFCRNTRSAFMTKIKKYRNILTDNGVNTDAILDNELENMQPSQSFDDNIELVLVQKSASLNACKGFWMFNKKLSLLSLFQWIRRIFQRVKAAKILYHINDIPETDILESVDTVAVEVAVAYEFHLSMLESDAEVIKLAHHAATCMIHYLNSRYAQFGCESLLNAILEVKPKSSMNKDIMKTRPIIHNGKSISLKWKLGKIFKQPGLRIAADYIENMKTIKTAENLIKIDESNDTDINEVLISSIKDQLESQQAVIDVDNNAKTDKEAAKPTDYREVTATIDNIKNIIYQELELTPNAILLNEKHSVENSFLTENGNNYQSISKRLEETEKICVEIDNEIDARVMHNTEHLIELIDTCSLVQQTCTTEDLNLIKNIESCNLSKNIATDCAEIDLFKNSVSVINGERKETDILILENNTVSTNINLIGHNIHFQEHSLCAEVCVLDNLLLTKSISPKPSLSDSVSDLRLEQEPIGTASTKTIYRFYGCFTPYGTKCRPDVYGFRGPLHTSNDNCKKASMIYNDVVTITNKHMREIPNDPNDFHQLYLPVTSCKH